MKKPSSLPLRIGSLTLAVVVTGLLVARAAGCTSTNTVEPVSPTSSPPPVTPTTPGDPGSAGPPPFSAPSAPPGDAGPTVSVPRPSADFMPATKSGMPFREPAPQAPQQQNAPQ